MSIRNYDRKQCAVLPRKNVYVRSEILAKPIQSLKGGRGLDPVADKMPKEHVAV